MIQRNKGVPDWILDNGKMERSSVSETSMSAFANSVLNQANQMKKAGKTDEEIAKAFNVEKETLKKVLREATANKAQCSCNDSDEKTTAKQEYDNMLSDAQKVYDKLHQKEAMKKDLPLNRDHSIMSARGGRMDISNEIGSNKTMGSETNNSIWDTEKIARAAKSMDNGERIRREKEQTETYRKHQKDLSRNHSIDGESLKQILSKTDQRKDSNIHSMAVESPAGYTKKLPQNGMSIFEDGFSRIKDRTGEMKQTKQKDRSWVQDGARQTTAKGLLSKMIDTMLEEKPTKKEK